MSGRTEKILWLLITAVFIAATHFYTLLYTPPSRTSEVRVVTIPKGASFRVVEATLKKAGALSDTSGFTIAAGLKGAYNKIKAGEYELDTTMTPLDVLAVLTQGRVKQYAVTFPEGYSLKDIAHTLEAAGLADKEEFLSRSAERRLTAALGFEGPNIEGYLFPDTYQFTKGMSPDEIMKKMTKRFREVFDSEFREKARNSGTDVKHLVTLASIIEKESGSIQEMPIISAVFHNRMKRGMPLQSDPTVIYGLTEFDGNLTKKHLLQKTPYNTYLFPGLPPGPIANPGKEALGAALNPAANDYLYFVSRNDGTHHFSKTLKEHNRAVNLYQRNIKTRAIKTPND